MLQDLIYLKRGIAPCPRLVDGGGFRAVVVLAVAVPMCIPNRQTDKQSPKDVVSLLFAKGHSIYPLCPLPFKETIPAEIHDEFPLLLYITHSDMSWGLRWKHDGRRITEEGLNLRGYRITSVW